MTNARAKKQDTTRAPIAICVVNQKGGAGKSSTCFHLGGHFASSGLNTLLVDADPQGSLSQGFFGSTAVENLSSSETLAALFDDEHFCSAPEQLPTPTSFERIAVVRANQTLAPHNVPEPEKYGLKQFVLGDFVRSLAGFDVTLIDCPPNLYQCTWNAMLAADFVVIPVPPEDFGTQGLRVVHQAIENARALNPNLRLLSHLVTRFDARLLVHQSYEQKLRSLYGDTVFTTVIPEASAFKVALACRTPVSHYSPKSRPARLTAELAQELLALTAKPETGRRFA
jgi:chromosome partitioning protein